MIRRMQISNFRSLGKDVRIDLGSLTVLVGPNGSGKSNVLDVLAFVRDAVSLGLPAAVTNRGGIAAVRRSSSGRPFDVHVVLELTLGDASGSYGFVITGDRKEEYRIKSEEAWLLHNGERLSFRRQGDGWQGPEGLAPRVDEQSLALTALGGSEQFKPVYDFLSRMTVYSIFPDKLAVPQKFDTTRPMRKHGDNWVSVLKDLIRDPEAKGDLVDALRRLTGDIEDVRVTAAASHLIVELKHGARRAKEKRWFDAGQQSDGTLRVAGLLTALLQQPALPVIGLEEPELTVHPGVLPVVYDFLRQAATVSQILVTTHSPVLLDCLDLDRVEILAVCRRDGCTRVRAAQADHLADVRKGLLGLGDKFLSGDLQLTLFESDQER